MINLMADTAGQNSYGKRPLWQWILIYVIAAIIIYGLIYYFVFARKAGYNAATSSTQSQTTTTAQQQNTVTLTQNGWEPGTLTIKAGETVTWVNKSGEDATVNSNPHPTHTDYAPLNLGSLSNNNSLSLQFPKSGTYGYHNHLNPSEAATIVVQ